MFDGVDLWGLLSGLGIFLFGMMTLEDALQKLSTNSFRQFLRRSTNNAFSSVFSGIITTAIVQSSSMVSLMVLAFVGAGMIPLYNAIGVVIGANLGTTFTGWIVTTLGFKMHLSALAIPTVGIGCLLAVSSDKEKRLNQIGLTFLGFGLLLFGLDLMKTSIESVAENLNIELLRGWHPITYLLAGALFTAIIQSSSASMMITLSALNAGIIDLPSCAALIIGADLGTTSTTALGALKGSITKKQVAMSHVLFNLVVDLLAFILLLPLLPRIMGWLDITDPLYSLVAFHSLFNFLGILLFLPLLQRFSRYLEHLFVDDDEVRKYIQNVPTDTIPEALLAVEKEVCRLFIQSSEINLRNLKINVQQLTIPTSLKQDIESAFDSALKYQERYNRLKTLEGELVEYASTLQQGSLSKGDGNRLLLLLQSARSAVYAAKNLKDIRDDLASFRHPDRTGLSDYLNNLLGIEQHFYQHILTLYQDVEHIDKEDIRDLYDSLRKMHDAFSHLLYQESREKGISELDSSTLLNVNRELLSSNRQMIESLRLLKRSTKNLGHMS
ncbi:Na/Pi cotransporter family protein [Litoribrevibacter albus]|nr:Na/Pi symporter [Litoribrevibacter albus]